MLFTAAYRLATIQQEASQSITEQQVRACKMLGSVGGMGIGKVLFAGLNATSVRDSLLNRQVLL